jgi:hypothetical protein
MDLKDEEIIYPWNSVNGRGVIINKSMSRDWREDLKLSGFKFKFQLFGYDDYCLEIMVYKHEIDETWMIDFWDDFQISCVTCDNEREKIECLALFVEMAKNIIFIRQQTEKFKLE